LIGLIPAALRIDPWHLLVNHRPYTFHDPLHVGLHSRVKGIIARLLGAVRGSKSQMKMTGAAEFVICDYAIMNQLCALQ
jgi:hypothetical protein